MIFVPPQTQTDFLEAELGSFRSGVGVVGILG